MSLQEIKYVRERFRDMDVDNDGFVESGEMINFMESEGDQRLPRPRRRPSSGISPT